jgi:hypothetical protein
MTRSRDTASIIPTLDAKGDLLVGTADNAIDNLPAGTNGTYLKANSASATGLEWATGVESIVDAKGDLLVGTADNTVDNLSPGTNGQVLTANSATTTGLEWTTPDSTNNVIINGAFDINQRNFSSTTTNSVFTFDRWFTRAVDGTSTFAAQSFAPGSEPLGGDQGRNYINITTSGQSVSGARTAIGQTIESVRTFAGQTVVLSFWAKSNSGTPSVAAYFAQNFGSGGSPSTGVDTAGQKVSITTSWNRYSLEFEIPSISGKTLGTSNDDRLVLFLLTSASSDWNFQTNSLGIQSTSIDIWGVQLEAGAVATPFRRNAPSIQAELAACQRYFWRLGGTGFSYIAMNQSRGGSFYSLGNIIGLPVAMRAIPSISINNLGVEPPPGGAVTMTTTATNYSTVNNIGFWTTRVSGNWATNEPGMLVLLDSTSFVQASAEL